jgi:hypothetical protein
MLYGLFYQKHSDTYFIKLKTSKNIIYTLMKMCQQENKIFILFLLHSYIKTSAGRKWEIKDGK